MKKTVKVFGWIAFYYLINSFAYYIAYMIKFKYFGWPRLWYLYGWYLRIVIDNSNGNTELSLHFHIWQSVFISTVIFLAVLVFVYRKKIISFLKMTFAKLKQNTKSARIARLEQELEELKKNK